MGVKSCYNSMRLLSPMPLSVSFAQPRRIYTIYARRLSNQLSTPDGSLSPKHYVAAPV